AYLGGIWIRHRRLRGDGGNDPKRGSSRGIPGDFADLKRQRLGRVLRLGVSGSGMALAEGESPLAARRFDYFQRAAFCRGGLLGLPQSCAVGSPISVGVGLVLLPARALAPSRRFSYRCNSYGGQRSSGLVPPSRDTRGSPLHCY